MIKKATYRKVLSFKWLFALSLVFSLVAFPGLVRTAEACRLLPQRIEAVTSGQDDTESTVFPYQVTDSEFSSNSLRKAREYEFKVQVVYQRQVKETLDTILARSYTYSPPSLFWIARVSSSLSDDNPPLTLG